MSERKDLTPSEVWGKTLPSTPLAQHLVSLHDMLLHFGAHESAMKVAEYSLREIAIYTTAITRRQS